MCFEICVLYGFFDVKLLKKRPEEGRNMSEC